MLKKRKFLIIGAIAAVVLVATVGGIALAQTATTPDDAANPTNPIMSRVATILGIDQQKLEDAFAQAKRESADSALDAKLKQMVDSGKLTQQQADQYKSWWQSRPDSLPGIGPMGRMGGRFQKGGIPWCLPRAPQSAPTQ